MRFLPLALLLALLAPQAQAQIVPSIDLGIAGGVNFADLSDATGLDLESSTGYHIGAYADVGVLLFSARTGLYYLWAGDLRDAASVGSDDEGNSVSFVTVPIDFQIQTPTPLVQAYLLVGPEFRFPVGDFENLTSTFDRENVNTILNVGVGVGGGLPLFGPSGFAELRYGYDVTGIGTDATTDENTKLNLVLLRVGFGI